jgi:glycogen synthase
MKLLLTADTVGGVWTHAMDLCRGLERFGVDVVLATMGAPLSHDQREQVHARRNVVLAESGYRLEWMPDAWRDVAAAGDWLITLERRVRPDVIHLNGYAHAALPWSAPVLLGAHSCVLSWWRAVHGCDAPPEWDTYRAAVAAGIAAADVVAAPTRALLSAIEEHYGRPRSAHVVANGTDIDRLQPAARDSAVHMPHSAPQPEPFVLAVGRVWDEGKNLRALAAAAQDIRWPVFVAGPDAGPDGERRPLHGVQQLGVLGARELGQWYARASIFVHPALYEPFGLAPLEAALSRTALVLGDIPSLREVWGDAAVFVPPSDPAAIAAAVNGLAADPAALRRCADAVAQRARSLTVRRMAAAYCALYRSLLPGDRHAAEAVACA